MMRTLTFFLALVFCLSCQENRIEKPDNLIAPEKMSDILYDIAVLEAIESNYRGQLQRNGIDIMPFVYEKYGVDSLQFASSDLYYASRPAIYEQIYQRVEDRIVRERDSVGEVIRQGNQAGREQVTGEKSRDTL